MQFLKISILIMLSVLSSYGQSQSLKITSSPRIEAKFKFENDSSLLNLLERWAAIARYEFTFSGVQDLPLIPELQTIEAVTFLDAIEEALGAYKIRNLNIIMEALIDNEKKHLYVSTSEVIVKGQEFKETTQADFTVSENDKSMMQVFIRWANQSGFKSFINDQPVNLQVFPRHVSRYPDFSLTPTAKSFKTQSKLKDAISQFISLYTGISLDPFIVRVDEENKRLYIVSLVRY